MPTMIRAACSVFTGFAVAACAAKPVADANPLEGAWRIVDAVATGADSSTNHNPQPSMLIFAKGYYSWIAVTTNTARVLFKAATPTDAERLDAYNSFVANSGTYQIADSTLTIRPVAARMPNFMAGGSEIYHFRTAGDTLWMHERSTDGRYRFGAELAPLPGVTETRYVLVRMH